MSETAMSRCDTPVRRSARLLLAFAAILSAGASLPVALEAQRRDSIPGVALGLLYETGVYQPPIAIKPFEGRFGGQALAGQVEAIVARDLRYSDRYRVMDSIPPALMRGEGVDYTLWDRLGADWLVTGQVEGSGSGYVLTLELHHVVYSQMRGTARFDLPEATHADFRMAVHRASDEVVNWTFGEPGMAASRIAFSMGPSGIKELYLIDSDGENLTRVTNHNDIVLSAAWAPDGNRIAYSSYHSTGNLEIFERDLRTGRDKKVTAVRDGSFITPAYHPDGETLAFAVQGGTRSGIYTYNIVRECCLANLTETSSVDLSPTFSPDGRRLAFNSLRLGDAVPQIFVMSTSGGAADLVSPYAFGQAGFYTSPSWSPRGDLVAFHGRTTRSGAYQILVARMGDRGRLTQLTWEGQNEDPAWAPDGRHLVFIGERSWGKGLFVVDTVTGAIRSLLTGVEVRTPDWSPALLPR